MPRAAVIAKHKETLKRASKSEAGRVKKAVTAALVSPERKEDGTHKEAKFRSRKEKLRAFEIGGRTTDYEDLTGKFPPRRRRRER